jgi:hypothetical protein
MELLSLSNNLVNIQSLSSAIRDAVAPVFLLTGIGSILGVLVNRLGRAIDRGRNIYTATIHSHETSYEYKIIVRRVVWIRRSIGLITFSGLCVSISIATLFIEVGIGINAPLLVSLFFVISMCSLIMGLICFLREISLATKEISFLNVTN